jgi:transcriptional regulator
VYIPKHFEVTDRALLQSLMREFSFATLVTVHEQRPYASHLPFVLEAEQGEHGTLVAHLARANAQWQSFDGRSEALVIFQGQHAYISPSWYEKEPNVPTWNYMVVHAYGVPRVIEDEARVRTALRSLVDHHEASFDRPWQMDLPEEYLDKMQRGIVAFEVPITRLEGKFKLSQNRSAHDRERVIEALAAHASPLAQPMQALVDLHRSP